MGALSVTGRSVSANESAKSTAYTGATCRMSSFAPPPLLSLLLLFVVAVVVVASLLGAFVFVPPRAMAVRQYVRAGGSDEGVEILVAASCVFDQL